MKINGNGKSDYRDRVCVIGAGMAGLCALRHSIQRGCDVICFEKTKELGGTWVFTDIDENTSCDQEVHSSMYEGLLTNLPKEVMGFPDFEIPNDQTENSYVTSERVLNFLKSYAAHFHLNERIKLQHEVIRVRPRSNIKENDKLWEVYVKNHRNGEFQIEFFDFIFVCNGHYSLPNYPIIENMESFKGKQIHSHSYRRAKQFEGESVLVIGAGASGYDIACLVCASAREVFFSHHSEKALPTPKGILHKPDVEHFTENGAVFKDGSTETFSAVIYCTGYKYHFPFLSADCGIHIEHEYVHPLYKHFLNINYPSMAFLGIPLLVIPSIVFDLQVRFAFKHYFNEIRISREDMLKDLKNDCEKRLKSGLPRRKFHQLGESQFDYYADLASTAEIEPIKPVIEKMKKENEKHRKTNLYTYRKFNFKVLDDFNFELY